MDTADVEFLAEDQPIEIVPNFSTKTPVNLFRGHVGPFVAGAVVEVPLWAAVLLRQEQKCRIVAPAWLTLEKLEEIKSREVEEKLFTRLPDEHFIETAQLIMQHGPKDVENADQIKTLLQDIWDARFAKLRSSMDVFVKSGQTHAVVNHLTPMEICRVRQFLISSLDHVQTMRRSSQGVDSINSSASQ